jgi:hypothetical protein
MINPKSIKNDRGHKKDRIDKIIGEVGVALR